MTSRKERWIYQQVAEMSKILGISAPEVGIAYSRREGKQMMSAEGTKRLGKRMLAFTNLRNDTEHKIVVLSRRNKTFTGLRRSIAHELIHVAFPKLAHGDSFEDNYIDSLLNGHLMFDGRGIVTEVVKPKPTIDKTIASLELRRKGLQTKVKRVSTAIKKIDRKIRHLEKKEKAEKNDGK